LNLGIGIASDADTGNIFGSYMYAMTKNAIVPMDDAIEGSKSCSLVCQFAEFTDRASYAQFLDMLQRPYMS
jgi:hypothetical protein